ncbi:hypothetical protein QE370_001054 [Aeromicrobium sp. SORGH_AS981]|jgi:hypothetical protein|nr:hypothetical protein [Aeromicrobium sp. SORGH_AS_0981]
MKKLLAVVLAALGVLWAVARRDDGTAATRTTWEQATDSV